MPGTSRSVAVLLGSDPMGLSLMRGVWRYFREHPFRRLWVPREWRPELLPRGGRKQFDGVVVRAGDASVLRRVAGWGVPAVNVSNATRRSSLPRVVNDDEEMGRLAARHLLERGFRHYAFIGFPQYLHARLRQAGFEAEVRKAGFACAVYDEPSARRMSASMEESAQRLRRWVEQLPKPCGVFGGEGSRGAEVLSACRALHLEVPAQTAVVAACNEDWWEFFAGISMSYIPLQFEQIGYEAAALLQRLVEGGAPPREPIRIPPGRLVVQESSDVYPYADEAARAALRFIEANLHRPFRIAELLATVPCSRRRLEMCFRHDTGRTLEKRIIEARVEKAKTLLAETDLSIKEIADRCGFRERERLHVAFRKGTGLTPAGFRRLQGRPAGL